MATAHSTGSPGSALLPYAAALLATCSMGLMGVFIRQLPFNDQTIAFIRFSLGFLFLAALALSRGRPYWPIRRPSLYPVLGGVCIALCMFCYIKAVKLIPLADAAFLLYLGPLLATAAAWAALGERLSLVGGLLLSAAFVGCALILGFGAGFPAAAWRGDLFGLGAGLFYALFILVNRMTPRHIPPLTRACWQLLCAGLTFAPFADVSAIASAPGTALAWALGMGFSQGLLGVGLMIFAIGRLRAYQYGTISYLEPVVAALAGVAFYSETMTWRQALGGLIIVGGGVGQTLLAARADLPARHSLPEQS